MQQQQVRHAVLTCYDSRIDKIVETEIAQIRQDGGLIDEKDIIRPPGGVHLLSGKTDCRKAFYEMLAGLHTIAGTMVFHLWPHTNCRYCGIRLQEKLGSGAQSDLRFHLRSATKMLDGAINHFAGLISGMPKLDVRIILTTDQRIITIDDAQELLPRVSPQAHHGASCLAGHHHSTPGHHPECQSPLN